MTCCCIISSSFFLHRCICVCDVWGSFSYCLVSFQTSCNKIVGLCNFRKRLLYDSTCLLPRNVLKPSFICSVELKSVSLLFMHQFSREWHHIGPICYYFLVVSSFTRRMTYLFVIANVASIRLCLDLPWDSFYLIPWHDVLKAWLYPLKTESIQVESPQFIGKRKREFNDGLICRYYVKMWK